VPSGKHAPVEFGRYFEIHSTAMARHERDGLVVAHDLRLIDVPIGVLIVGRIRCQADMLIDVDKILRVHSGEGQTAIVQTDSYSYHALVEGLGNLLRYCSPHNDAAHPDHRPYHHKHVFDPLSGDAAGCVEEIEADEWPTLSEVIHEVCGWYFEHSSEVETRRRI
jgi:hypothetical protein